MNDSVTSKGTFRFFVCVRLYSLSQAKQEKWENSSKQINETNDTLNAMHRMTISRYSSIVFFPENRTKRYTLTRAGSFINFFSPSVFEPSFGHFHSRFILTALSVLFIYKRKCLHNRKKLLNKTKPKKYVQSLASDGVGYWPKLFESEGVSKEMRNILKHVPDIWF